MGDIQKIVKKLNNFLDEEHLNEKQFENSLKHIFEIGIDKVKIKIIDFEYHNEERLKHATKEKIEEVKSQNFEWAAKQREIEKKCKRHIELKKEYNIEKSMFYYEHNFLLYFYFGTSKNDKIIKELIKSKIESLTIEPRYAHSSLRGKQ
ncbi:MAG: hypothetical protein KAT68_01585 [Bacteroidales bacterium]|nr:hypothetical protein [Bacteroidales bacterium]